MIRVIAGLFKGRKLKVLKGDGVRPTSDKVKGAMFNIIGKEIEGAVVLDLFSGSGSLGIESISRGSKKAVFVDSDKRCIGVIRENLQALKIEDVTIMTGDVYRIISKLKEDRFNIVFADPPYNKDLAKNILSHLGKYSILSNSCLIIIEHSKKELIEENELFCKVKDRDYGDTVISIYKYIK